MEAKRGIENLRPREHEVLQLMVTGKDTFEIAEALKIEVGTVRAHRQAIYRTVGVRNLARLTLLWHKLCTP